jgi:uncharacterized FlaG/YvyC family protein
MKYIVRVLFVVSLSALLSAPALAQVAVPPPPKPADSGPSLAATMQFIQDRMNNQGSVGYIETRSNLSAETFRKYYVISGVVADASACTLQTTETYLIRIEVDADNTYIEGGKPVTGDDLLRRYVYTKIIHLRDVESIRVESKQDAINRDNAENAHPEITVSVVPAVYSLGLVASKQVFTYHASYTVGKQPAKERDVPTKELDFSFRDEETANRLAKAFTHAIELCGGGDKDLFAPTAQEKDEMERTRQQQAEQDRQQAQQLAAQKAQQQAVQQQAQQQADQQQAQQQAIADCQQQCRSTYNSCESDAKAQTNTAVVKGVLGVLFKSQSTVGDATNDANGAQDAINACNDSYSSCTAACQ